MIKKKQITEANSKTGAKIDSKTGDKTDLNGGKKDLNNLFLRLIIQQERQPGLIGGEQWAEILKILIDREVAAGGPYYNENDVVDLGLNIRIAFLLKTQKVALSKLLKFIQTSKSKLNEIDTQIKFK
ncbi:MAG: hypothetical protein NTX66_01600, partial [Candidatus Falkowbacteria bacterium]|nr:hypothetical protein [Candidatus Falkowbacteria bacterium]